MSRMYRLFLISASFLILAQLAIAQGDPTTASLHGVITDTTGALVPRASVTLQSSDNGIVRTAQTDGTGHYAFQLLPPAQYTLSATLTGFKSYRQQGISLDPGQSATQDVVLEVGSSSEQIVVTSQAPLLQTDNANISADVSARQVVELPLNLRNIFGLATLNSSVNNTTQSQVLNGGGASTNGNADQDISFLSFGGGFFGTSAFLLDGIWDTAGDWGGVVYVPSVDSVEEFKVQNNSFTAQYGWSTGNVINVVTKSGTSKFHGSAFEFYRNSALDSNLYFANAQGLERPDFHRNQFGFSAGGPLYIPRFYKQREKTFVFGLYEHLYSSTPSVATNTVPTAGFLAGDFSAALGSQQGVDALGRPILTGQIYDPSSARLLTAGQVDPKTGLVARSTGYIRNPVPGNNLAAYTTLNPQAVRILSYYPHPTSNGLVNNFAASGTAPSDSNEYTIRIDHNFTQASRIYGRYSYKSEYKTGAPEYWGASDPAGPGNLRPNNRYQLVLGFNHVFTPTFMMNLTGGFEHWGEGSNNQSKGFHPSTLGLPGYLDQNSAEFPIIAVGGGNASIPAETALGPTGGAENTAYRPTGSIGADFNKIVGHHTLSFGFMGVESQNNFSSLYQTQLNFGGTFTDGPDPDAPSSNTGNGVAQALFGVIDGGNTGVAFNPAISKKYSGLYLQDDWAATSKLTLNIGVRYETQLAPTYRHNTASFFDPALPNPIGTAIHQTLPGAVVFTGSNHRGTYDTNWTNIAPRLGLSYSLLPKLAVRGGFGLFYPPSAYLGGASTSGFSTSTNVIPAAPGSRVPDPSVTISNPWPQGLRSVTGNTLGQLQDVGFSTASYWRSRKSSYVEQWMFGIQYGFTKNDVLDVTYVGNHGLHMLTGGLDASQLDPKYLPMGTTALNNPVSNPFYGQITSSGCNLGQPTVSQSQLLQPFPQFCGVTQNDAPAGFSNYNALQVNYNRRFSQGLNLLVSYTFSKFIDNVEGTNSWAYTSNAGPANNYNLAAERSVDSGDIPHSLVVNYIYELPVGRGKKVGSHFNRTTNAVLGGWQVSGITTAKSGIPLGITGSNINSYGGNPRPDVTGNVHLQHKTIQEWFNTNAFALAPYGTFGTAPRNFSDLRGPGYQNWDLSIMKNWNFTEDTRLQFRAEMYNAFNHANFYTPNTGLGSGSFGVITNTFPARDIQLAMKFYW
ncbi:TonB-dependent receptor [Paracidobacterium acidisoli]|uniref:TonB-dependent transporter Oar-like beta-barrel domain-containing protein n=1 Tax=Paracidobacterium acidisoli TaxID=2303751 RepID=A0A372IQI4_9BACT|nr:TonB-dependent receptor [Paracidobacterium acidisoli]MBT9331533.1 TonB-dependent receptor [Paracidobacterium acidisoli]